MMTRQEDMASMANFISLTGFVSSDVQISSNGKSCSFSINFYDTRRNDEAVYSFMTVKVFDFSATPKKKDLVNVCGSLHKHIWNGKEYTEIWCNYDGWSKIERRNKENSNGNNNAQSAAPKQQPQRAEASSNNNLRKEDEEIIQNEFPMEEIPF